MTLLIEKLGRLITAKRGGRGVRSTAIDVGISHATLFRVENGHMPDLETFAKICRWLDRDPREFLGMKIQGNSVTIELKRINDMPKRVTSTFECKVVGPEGICSELVRKLGEIIERNPECRLIYSLSKEKTDTVLGALLPENFSVTD